MYDQMADAGFNLQQCSFLSEFHNLQISLLPKHPFILRSSFLSRISRFMRVLSKMALTEIIQNGGFKWQMQFFF